MFKFPSDMLLVRTHNQGRRTYNNTTFSLVGVDEASAPAFSTQVPQTDLLFQQTHGNSWGVPQRPAQVVKMITDGSDLHHRKTTLRGAAHALNTPNSTGGVSSYVTMPTAKHAFGPLFGCGGMNGRTASGTGHTGATPRSCI